jgi:hypothetical protein
MNRFFSFAIIASLLAPAALAQTVTHGQAELAFVKVRNANGTYTTYRGGGTFPITIEPIQAEVGVGTVGQITLPPLFGKKKRQHGGIMPANLTTYQNEFGSYFVAAEGSSCLDDQVHTAAGNGQPWKIVKFGVHISNDSRTGKFLVRWRGYETFTSNLGPGVMAFSDEFFDAGFYIERNQFPPTPPGASTFLVTGDLTLNPIFSVPSQTCFLASQFRVPNVVGFPPAENGEGAFSPEWNVFANNGPQIGTSEDLFWYDSPPDGVYDETEVDAFDPEEGGAGAGNFLFKTEINSGPTQTVNPFTFQWVRGTFLSGNVGSLWFDDGNYNSARAGFTLSPTEPPAQIVVESLSPTPNPLAMRFDVDAKANTPGLSMKVELFNFVTNQYVQVVSGTLGTTDTALIGFSATPGQCVQPGTNTIRAKVSFYRTGLTLLWPWSVSVDRTAWTITSP